MESIEHEQTGLLCDANAADFSAAMNSLLKHKDKVGILLLQYFGIDIYAGKEYGSQWET